jgi:hypothetical protein
MDDVAIQHPSTTFHAKSALRAVEIDKCFRTRGILQGCSERMLWKMQHLDGGRQSKNLKQGDALSLSFSAIKKHAIETHGLHKGS